MEPISIAFESGCRTVTSSGQYYTLGTELGDQIRVVNAGASPVCILPGTGSQTAVFPTNAASANGAGVYIPAGNTEIFTVRTSTSLHCICAAGQTTTLYISKGGGE